MRRLAFTVPLAAVLAGCGVNSVPTAEETAKARWADVQAAYQRRANLIPNLAATVKGAAASEKSILVGVTQARAQAVTVQLSGDDLKDEGKVRQYAAAQAGLSAALVPLRQLQEQYPDLKSQANFSTFMSQLEGTENRINVKIGDYNEAVQAYNTRIRTFPDAVGAKVFYGAKPMVPFQAEKGAETAPKVDFN
ncbi:LemA family protein [Sphingomonas bacterium]|uniref:LemA family protein n=1 Tax=Sphingomonas bacterium TaxID=1895847 RepID=UPI0015770FAD|nr:LemA family protein [Sphingomonas bacterium]